MTLLWLCLVYCVGFILTFMISQSLSQGSEIIFDVDHDYDCYNPDALTPKTFWQQCWLDLRSLGNLKQNWLELTCYLLWPIVWAIIIIVICILLLIGLGCWLWEQLPTKQTEPSYQIH